MDNLNRLKKLAKNAIKDALHERASRPNQTRDLLVEMARINKRETYLFPYQAWEIKIWSNDHNPPHFHILKDGWDVSFGIETGDMLQIKNRGTNQTAYDYMLANVNPWLDAPCALSSKITNREAAMIVWLHLHDDE